MCLAYRGFPRPSVTPRLLMGEPFQGSASGVLGRPWVHAAPSREIRRCRPSTSRLQGGCAAILSRCGRRTGAQRRSPAAGCPEGEHSEATHAPSLPRRRSLGIGHKRRWSWSLAAAPRLVSMRAGVPTLPACHGSARCFGAGMRGALSWGQDVPTTWSVGTRCVAPLHFSPLHPPPTTPPLPTGNREQGTSSPLLTRPRPASPNRELGTRNRELPSHLSTSALRGHRVTG